MGARMRALPWTVTELGPVESWPQSLRTSVSICLGSQFPIVLYWGPHLITLYNDAYAPILAKKHPWALGHPCQEVWAEIWDVIAPMLESVTVTGEATWSDDQLLILERHGYAEECYFSFSFSPVRGDAGRVDGIFTAVIEHTQQVVGERRLRTLRELAAGAVGAKTAEQACERGAETLGGNSHDLPFAAIYLLEADGKRARLGGAAGLKPGTDANPPIIHLDPEGWAAWPFARVGRTRQVEVVEELTARFGPLPGGPWPESPKRALVLPIPAAGQDSPAGFVAAGVSPRRALDEGYRAFVELIAGQLGASIADARALEAERRRAEMLAELDRAKTAFFSNVSHEFRTPLTLMLGPVEDILAKPAEPMCPENRELLTVVHRNGLRLQKLVNTLLDFSRIEAGRVQAVYEPTDLSALTAELASNFRSACERAGLRLVTDCPPVGEPVYVDRDMWEKVVLNLVSNAFKFTFEGEIAVIVRRATDAVELAVRDTGIGIPPREIPHLFERFHRVKCARGRTHEGSGIGLALVQELVKLHGGAMRVESLLDRGSTFIVSIPMGKSHLPADRIGGVRTLASTALGDGSYVEEALRWLPESEPASLDRPRQEAGLDVPLAGQSLATTPSGAHREKRDGAPARILWADDNADMRDYVRRLLSAHYDVDAVPDGRAALAAARACRPDLVLADVMMPHLDGFELLRELRADPQTRMLPVILLSARAGEESRVEGLAAGADDYLIKPFSARELLARVTAHLRMARVRQEAERTVQDSEDKLRTRNARLVLLSEALQHLLSSKDPDRIVRDLFPRVAAHLGIDTYFNYMVSASSGRLILHSYAGVSDQTAEEFRHLELGPSLCGTLARIQTPVVAADILHSDHKEAALVRSLGLQAYACNPLVSGGRLLGTLSFASRTRPSFEHDELEFIRLISQYVAVAVERAKVEQTLRESEERLESLVTNAPIAIAVVQGMELRYVLVNPTYQSIVGAEVALLGRPYRDVFPEAAERGAEESLRQVLRTGQRWQMRDFETPIPGRAAMTWWDGEVLTLPESPDSLLILTWEVTERKRAEAALREADRAKDEFLAMLGHELRNPVGAIGSAIRVLEDVATRDATARRAQAVIDRQVRHLARLVDDLLDVGRVTAGKITLVRRPLDLAEVAGGVVSAWRASGRLDGHRATLTATPVWVEADETRLEQVVSNLLGNAVKFTPMAGAVTVRVRPDGGDAVLEVEDTGVGISAELIGRVFDLFVQDEQSPDRARGGLGIGLTLVRRLVERHGGTVTARSAGLGRGSVFTVRLPAMALPAQQPGPGTEPASKEPRRILLIEDNDDAREMLRFGLEREGHTVLEASAGQEGLELATSAAPDVALIDIGLPGLDGYEVARRIRAAVGRMLTLVALTGYGTADDRRRAEQAGFDVHLVKPIDLDRLIALIAATPRRPE
jgi:signal transduction histidine kinase/DNA-binding response OmpR family regulator